MSGIARSIMLCWLGVLVAFGGCGRSRSPVLHVLSAAVEPDGKGAVAGGGEGLRIGVAPVAVPAYLDRPQMVTRRGPNTLDVSEFHRWAEPLGDGLRRVLIADLSALLPAGHVMAFPGSRGEAADFVVVVRVVSCERGVGGVVALAADWDVRGGAGGAALVSRHSSLRKTVGDASYAASAGGLSALLGDLSREIAGAVGEARRPR